MNNNFWTVISFTMRNKLRTKSFIVTSIIFALILSIGVNVPYVISLFNKEEAKLVGYVTGQEDEIVRAMLAYYGAMEKPDIALIAYADAGSPEATDRALRDAISNKEIKSYILFEPADSEGGFPKVTYKSEELFAGSTANSLNAALQHVKTVSVVQSLGLTEQQQALLNTPVQFETAQISVNAESGEGKTEGQRGIAMGFVYAMMILLFMGIFVTSQLIATEITAEKSSRVMEILVTSVSPLTQMFGKIFGMFLIGLMQIGFYVLVFILNVMLPHNKSVLEGLNINFADIDPSLYIFALVFYLMGYFLYSTMFAAVGSIVSRTEDLAQALMPITFLSIGGFYIGIFGMTTPGATIVEVASFIPFFAPFVMFLRIGLTDPAFWEIALSLGLLLACILLFGWLSAKIYRTGVLMYGKRPTWKELRKAMKAYKV